MPLRWFAFLIIALTFAISAFAGQGGDGCEAKLVTGDRYYGAFAAALKSRALDSADLETALASETPFNPLEKSTPSSRNSAARAAFAELVRDAEVIANWQTTRALLRTLQANRHGVDQERDRAKRSARAVVYPQLVQTIPNVHMHMAFTTLSDGTAVVARIDDQRIVISRLADLHELHSANIPHLGRGFSSLAWHRDENEKLWLYYTHVVSTAAGKNHHVFYRIDFDAKTDLQVFPVDFSDEPRIEYMFSIGPETLLAKVFAHGRADFMNILNWRDARAAALAHVSTSDGELLLPEQSKVGTDRLFRLRDGRVLKVFTGEIKFKFRAELDGKSEEFDKPRFAGRLYVYQTRMGRILLAYTRSGREDFGVDFFEFGTGLQNAFYSPTLNGQASDFHWFESEDGQPYFAASVAQGLVQIDPLMKTVLTEKDLGAHPYFFRLGNELLAYALKGTHAYVYRMFTEPVE